MTSSGSSLMDELHRAMNEHDAGAMADCLDPDYKSEQPLHPERQFDGRDQVRKNWSLMFQEVPDLKADLLRSTVSGDEIWTEWHMHGTKTDGAPFEYRGTAIWGSKGGKITWGRLYFEAVTSSSAGIDEAMKHLLGRE